MWLVWVKSNHCWGLPAHTSAQVLPWAPQGSKLRSLSLVNNKNSLKFLFNTEKNCETYLRWIVEQNDFNLSSFPLYSENPPFFVWWFFLPTRCSQKSSLEYGLLTGDINEESNPACTQKNTIIRSWKKILVQKLWEKNSSRFGFFQFWRYKCQKSPL